MTYSYSKGYIHGRNGTYCPHEPVTMYDNDWNTKEMQDYEEGYLHGVEDEEEWQFQIASS